MFKSWYSNFYNQLTKFSNNNNNNSNTFTRKNNTNSNNNDNCEFKNSQNNLSQVVYFNMATNNQSKPNKSKLSASNNSDMRFISYSAARSTALNEFIFLTSTLVPNLFGFSDIEILSSTRISPFSIFASDTSRYRNRS